MDSSRRAFLSYSAAGLSGIGLGKVSGLFRRFLALDEPSEFPPPHVLHPRAMDWAMSTEISAESTSISVEGIDQPLLHRVWDPDARSTIEVRELETSEGEVTVESYSDEAIDMLYRINEQGHVEYLFDASVPAPIRDSVRHSIDRGVGPQFERAFSHRAIQITTHLDGMDGSINRLEIPYSAYLHARNSNSSGPVPDVPTPADNPVHTIEREALLEAIGQLIGDPQSGKSAGGPEYQQVEDVARFVQSIPHATDWESKRRPHYVRRPSEVLVELTADCKDAALFLYLLLDTLGYDPALILLVRDPIRENAEATKKSDSNASGDGGKEKKSSDEAKQTMDDISIYPNHVAVGVPLELIEPLPEEVGSELTTVEKNDREFAYIESIKTERPGVYPEGGTAAKAVAYHNRRDVALDFIPWV